MIMIYKLLLFFSLLLSSIEVQATNRFSDKINMKKFISEYWGIDKDKSDIVTSKTNIAKLANKYSQKYNVDLNVSDTIFILETCFVESPECYGSLWSKKSKIDFRYSKKIKFSIHNIWKKEEIDALFGWDKNIFKSLDEEGSSWLPSNVRDATRIIICNGTIYTDRLKHSL